MKPAPFLITVTKIIAYYCLFYAAVKIYAIVKGMWFWPNLLIAVFLGIVAWFGFRVIKKETYNWYFAGICIVLLSALRYYEPKLIPYLHGLFAS
ncbi:hypothetical protein [Galbibacter pacificus]|uniref:Uncharacterized protein n=1 Tax=Galbibacter pacificus TaxID=2996052 RepID=A0ABT6FVQ3_9FLAO|nr:hypothetical protein [Galbibacter pacificus]MDG3583916.1 hypothetical protein [Galbibacter pacificus]MDG3587166.1 hypothetical protein [Galbibacter pacificus]